MTGGFTDFAGGSVRIEIGGSAAGQFGRITIHGSAHSMPLRVPAPAQGTRASAPVAPVIKSITKVDDNFHIEFQSIAGRSYRVEWTDDLVAGKWTVLTNEVITGTGGMIKVIDAGAGTQKQCFYRVVETQTAAMKNPEVTR